MNPDGLLDQVTFGPELIGQGWHAAEWARAGKDRVRAFRWMGAEEVSVTFAAGDAPRVVLSCSLAGVIHPAVLNEAAFAIDGVTARGAFTTEDGAVALRIEGDRDPSAPISRLGLAVPKRFRPADVIPGSTDRRALSIAFKGIDVVRA